mmetsp:Transcript_6421/g.10159  ORF Transcript_6421/g.10159 Transcript_6421/m.10159 type:complete len:206 (-) Transcript_6421:854-1471(-)
MLVQKSPAIAQVRQNRESIMHPFVVVEVEDINGVAIVGVPPLMIASKMSCSRARTSGIDSCRNVAMLAKSIMLPPSEPWSSFLDVFQSVVAIRHLHLDCNELTLAIAEISVRDFASAPSTFCFLTSASSSKASTHSSMLEVVIAIPTLWGLRSRTSRCINLTSPAMIATRFANRNTSFGFNVSCETRRNLAHFIKRMDCLSHTIC